MKLTPKQQCFCDEYLIDLNATQAAIRAGYSEKVAKEIGYENLTKPHIKAYIDKRRDAIAKKIEITQEKVVNELAKIGFSNISDFLTYRTAKTVVDREKDGTSIIDYAQIIELKDSDTIDTSAVKSVKKSRDGAFTFELHDKLGALRDIAKHLGMSSENIKISGDSDNPLSINLVLNELEQLTDDEIDDIIASTTEEIGAAE